MFKYIKALKKHSTYDSMYFAILDDPWNKVWSAVSCLASEAITKRNRHISFLTAAATINNHQRREGAKSEDILAPTSPGNIESLSGRRVEVHKE